ncbi:hypothetical protein [Flagellimonas sp.]|uniref:hypothetical protein n=1 Tax=Flagellimonas sp. TaxID=2058762 RepID=UPI003B501126
MKKLVHYPCLWQAYPFSMEMFAHFEKEARLRERERDVRVSKIKKERKSKLKLALGW